MSAERGRLPSASTGALAVGELGPVLLLYMLEHPWEWS